MESRRNEIALRTAEKTMKLIFPKFRECAFGGGAILAWSILATTAAGFQNAHSGETTDPYFQKPRNELVRDTDFPRVAEGANANLEPGWIQNGSNYQSKSMDATPKKSIIRSTQDWNEKHVDRNEPFEPERPAATADLTAGQKFAAENANPELVQTDLPESENHVVPPWRRNLSTPARKAEPDQKQDLEVLGDSLSAPPPAATVSSTTRQSPFEPSANHNPAPQPESRQSFTQIQSQPAQVPENIPAETPMLQQVSGLQSQPAGPNNNANAIASTFENRLESREEAVRKVNSFKGDDFLPLGSTEESAPEESRPLAQPPATEPETDSQTRDSQLPGKTDDAGKLISFEPGRVLALVGGEPIFVGDMMFEVNNFIKKVAPDAPESVVDQQRPILMKKMLPRFVDSKLLYVGTVRELPEKLDMEKILEQAGKEFDDKALAQMMEQTGTRTTAEFDAHLRMLGSSLRKMRRTWAKEQLVRFFLSKQLNVDTDVTHQEMLDFYREHEAEYLLPARAKWEQVMVRFDQFSSREEARKAIVELGDKIVYGAKLDAVAKESSQGYLASEGGQHDWTTQDALVLKELDKAIFELPVGKLSDIIETRDGYHIVRVIEREAKGKKSFLEAQVEIKKKLEEQKREAAFREHLTKLKQEIPVQIFDIDKDELPAGTGFSPDK
jgi:parvulin-like peptidyl-prolyl isomerase